MPSIRKFWHSLHWRLTLISMTATLMVLAGSGGAATWRLHRELLAGTKDLHDVMGGKFRQDVNTYQEMYSAQESLAKAVAKYTEPAIWFRVVDEQGEVLMASGIIDEDLPQIEAFPSTPELVQIEGRSLILCSVPLQLRDQTTVQVESISDVTQSYQIYTAFLQTLALSGTGAVLVVTLGGLVLIRRSLRPLHDISQVTHTISAKHLQDAQVVLTDPPSEVAQLAEAFNGMLHRLSQAWVQEQQLLSNISHELRTPLSIVQGYLESTLRRGQNLTEIQSESLSTAHQETQRVVRLLKDLLDLTRAETGAFHLQIQAVNLNEFLRELEGILTQLGPNPIRLVHPEQDIIVKADPDRLKQVMLNLLTNAIRYSEAHAPITIRLRLSGEMALLQVQDQGIGIPVEHQPLIFERFYSVSEARSRSEGGIGLGLAITKALVENMRGRITVESQPQLGSTFTVSLPVISHA